MADEKKLAVVLFNLGGPQGMADIEPFLFNFFMDKNIIQLPQPFRFMLAKWISFTRSRNEAKEAYQHFNGKSPLVANTQAQAAALEAVLKKEFPNAKVFMSMRYWHPMSDAVVKDVIAYAPDEIVLLPLYPQYSTTTTFSSFSDWRRASAKHGLNVSTKEICCYPTMQGFIDASIAHLRFALQDAPEKTRILFSAHGLPEKIIQQGDPYQAHCEATAEAIARQMKLPAWQWQLCYQSRVGRLKWIGPSTDEALEKAADDGVGVVVYPLAFVSEHVETLVEIDIEYRHRAKAMGIPYFAKAETVGVHLDFINGLKDTVISSLQGTRCQKPCQGKFEKCFCKANA